LGGPDAPSFAQSKPAFYQEFISATALDLDHALYDPAGLWMHCVKLLGQRLPAWKVESDAAEIQIPDVILNGFTALGTPRMLNLSGVMGSQLSGWFEQRRC
jgi:hypothetical protein